LKYLRYISQKYYNLSIHDADAFQLHLFKKHFCQAVTGCYSITILLKKDQDGCKLKCVGQS